MHLLFTWFHLCAFLFSISNGYYFPEEEDMEPETQYAIERAKPGIQANPIMYYDYGGFPGRHNDFVIFNFGRNELLAETVYASHITRWVIYTTANASPNETKFLSVDGNFYITKLQMQTKGDSAALMYAYRGKETTGPTFHDITELPTNSSVDVSKVLRVVRRFASKAAMKFIKNPFGGIGLSMFIDQFFGNKEVDPWDQIKDRLNAKLEESQIVVISAILENDLKPIQEKIKRIQKTADTGKKSKIARKVLNLIDAIVGYENKFVFSSGTVDDNKINVIVLPLYVQAVNMKLAFHSWSLSFADKLGLDEEDVEDITEDRDHVIKKASSYINEMYVSRDRYAYEECGLHLIYNCVMDLRSSVIENGIQYVHFWGAIKKSQEKIDMAEPIAVSYSPYFGRGTINHYRQLFIEFGNPPLTPELKSDETRAKLTKILLHFKENNMLVGATEYFDTGKEYAMGDVGTTSSTINLNGSRIEDIEVGGDGIVNYIIFHLSDGRKEKHGKNFDRGYHGSFKKERYFISSFYVANDAAKTNGQIVNIACSYLLKPEDAAVQDVASENEEYEEKKEKEKKEKEKKAEEEEEDSDDIDNLI